MDRPRLPGAARRVVAANAVQTLGIGLVLPLTLIYLHRVRHIPLGTTGLLLAIPGLIGLASVPLAGALADRIGARPVLMGCMGLVALAQVGLAFCTSAHQAAPVLVLQGLALAPTFPTSNALLAAVTPMELQQRVYGVSFTLVNAAVAVGTIIGALTVNVDNARTFQAMFFGNALANVAAAAVVMTVAVPRPAAHEHAARGGYRLLLADPLMRRTILLSLLLALVGYGTLESGLPAFANVVAQVPVRTVALALTANTILIVGAQLFVLRVLEGRRRTRALALVGLLWCASWLIFGASALPDSLLARELLVIGFGLMFGIGETFMAPTITPLINALAPEAARARAQAMWGGVYQIALIVSPAISAGFIAAGLGGLWIGLLVAGCLAVTAVALGLSHRVPIEKDRGHPVLPAEPLGEAPAIGPAEAQS
jgi:MFS family permease